MALNPTFNSFPVGDFEAQLQVVLAALDSDQISPPSNKTIPFSAAISPSSQFERCPQQSPSVKVACTICASLSELRWSRLHWVLASDFKGLIYILYPPFIVFLLLLFFFFSRRRVISTPATFSCMAEVGNAFEHFLKQKFPVICFLVHPKWSSPKLIFIFKIMVFRIIKAFSHVFQ